ncbi:MAG TPA: bifunctional hydroxymethylpyrimidine kinase/phosphomethylpyrimidine kinase [Thermoanaerobaculia bacterium]|nr:bifunctional hydroxymethylpyrimidine kinase/phosphomethylpyrimidine kinase [Thermoanaerobaculia bacterium]
MLTIAGSDSGGGAGIQADLKTFAAHGVYGLSAVTAITAQNTREVRAVAPVEPAMVAAQIDAVLDDFGADAVKIGMLWSAGTIRAVAARLRAHLGAAPASARPPGETPAAGGGRAGRMPIVLDPVLAAGTGAPLVDTADAAAAEAIAALIEELLPLATLVTPNLPELERLAGALAAAPAPPRPAASSRGVEPVGEAARLGMARLLAGRGPAVLAKGGHDLEPESTEVVDLLLIGEAAGSGDLGGERVFRFVGPRLRTRAAHGTGCTLSAAVAARLATGEELAAAVGGAIEYVRRAMASAPRLGGGPSPLAHFIRPLGDLP